MAAHTSKNHEGTQGNSADPLVHSATKNVPAGGGSIKHKSADSDRDPRRKMHITHETIEESDNEISPDNSKNNKTILTKSEGHKRKKSGDGGIFKLKLPRGTVGIREYFTKKRPRSRSAGEVTKQDWSSDGSPTFASREKLYFGVAYQALIDKLRPPGDILPFLKESFDFLEENAITTEGIFRLGCSKPELDAVKELIEKGEYVDVRQQDPHLVANLIKSFLREMPDPLLCFQFYKEFIGTLAFMDKPSQLQHMQCIISKLPRANHVLLHRLLRLCSELVQKHVENKMTSNNLGIVLSPNILYSPDPNPVIALEEVQDALNVVSMLIENYKQIFEPTTMNTTAPENCPPPPTDIVQPPPNYTPRQNKRAFRQPFDKTPPTNNLGTFSSRRHTLTKIASSPEITTSTTSGSVTPDSTTMTTASESTSTPGTTTSTTESCTTTPISRTPGKNTISTAQVSGRATPKSANTPNNNLIRSRSYSQIPPAIPQHLPAVRRNRTKSDASMNSLPKLCMAKYTRLECITMTRHAANATNQMLGAAELMRKMADGEVEFSRPKAGGLMTAIVKLMKSIREIVDTLLKIRTNYAQQFRMDEVANVTHVLGGFTVNFVKTANAIVKGDLDVSQFGPAHAPFLETTHVLRKLLSGLDWDVQYQYDVENQNDDDDESNATLPTN